MILNVYIDVNKPDIFDIEIQHKGDDFTITNAKCDVCFCF